MQIEDSILENSAANSSALDAGIRPKVQQPAPGKKSRVGVIAAVLVAVLVLLAIGAIPRFVRASEAGDLAKETTAALPVVVTTPAHLAPPTSELLLPGNIEGVYVSPLYARTNGYVKQRFVDIGDKVKAGQLLALIESPEIDQELAQAKAAASQTSAAFEQAKANLAEAQAGVVQSQANLEQAKANQEIAQTTDTRWSRLVAKGVLPKQEGDERRSAYNARQAEVAAANASIQTAQATVTARQAAINAAQANINAAQANVSRLEQMVSFERVVAPFDGVITERKVERGNLVTAGSGTPQSQLFSIAQASILRIQVQVPQAYAAEIQNGQTAQVSVRGQGQTVVTGKVVRSANALDSQSRTLLTEIQVDNRQGSLLPGMYAEVQFVLPRSRSMVLAPADTLVVNGEGTRVITIGSDRKIHYQTIQIGRDLGPEVEVMAGLRGGEQLVSNPVDSLLEGQPVQVQATPVKAAK
jgi:RND family efflux transporter MFP subunit